MRTIGAYEAKTHLPRLLDDVAKGETITITKHGAAVALLIPAPQARTKSIQEVIELLRQFRRGKTLGVPLTGDLLHEGHRY